jgi:polar amino acid transport system permease protein
MSQSNSFANYLGFLLGGVPITLEITALAMLLTVPTAFALALGKMSRLWLLRMPASFVIELFRGTSALVQLFWAYYVFPFFGINLPPLWAGVLVLGLNEGSYFAEMVRPALQSVLAGQRDAAVSLHLPTAYRFFRITLPQAMSVLLPPFGNTLVDMLKFTSLVSLVTIQELSFRASLIRSSVRRGDEIWVFLTTLGIYFVLALILVSGVRWLGRIVDRWAGRRMTGQTSVRRSPVPLWALGR